MAREGFAGWCESPERAGEGGNSCSLGKGKALELCPCPVPAVHGEGTGQLQHPGLQLPLPAQGCGRSCNSINELNMLGSAFAIQNNMIMKENYKVIVINGPQVGRELTQAGITLGHGPAAVPGEGGRGGRSWSC